MTVGATRACRTLVPDAPGAEQLVVAALAVAVVARGGYYGLAQAAVGVALVAALVLTAYEHHVPALAPSLRLPATALAAAAGTLVVAAVLRGHPSQALGPVGLLAAVGIVAGACAGAGTERRAAVTDRLLELLGLLAASGTVGVALHREPLAHPDGGLWRAAGTVTYANATAALLTTGLLLALARSIAVGGATHRDSGGAAEHSGTELRRALLVALLVTGLLATQSRGGLLAAAAGLAVLVVRLGPRAVLRAGAAPAVGGTVAAVGLLPSVREGAGAEPVPALLGLLIGAAVTTAVLLRQRHAGRRSRLLFTAGAALSGAGLVIALVGAAPGSALARAAGAVRSDRLTAASPDRSAEMHAALVAARSDLALGVGPLQLEWVRPDGAVVQERYAHDEYLQLLAEDGAPAALVVSGAIGVLLLTRRGLLRRADHAVTSPAGALAVVGTAVAVAVLVQSGLDFLWHVPAVPLTAAAVLGLSTPTPTPKDPS